MIMSILKNETHFSKAHIYIYVCVCVCVCIYILVYIHIPQSMNYVEQNTDCAVRFS
jgi:hypothetical protein